MTECIQESFGFTAHFSRRVETSFSGGQVTSDGGALLLREVDGKINLLGRLTACFTDKRSADRVEHTLSSLLAQRIFGLALGYEDLNDHEQLRNDPLLGVQQPLARDDRHADGAGQSAAYGHWKSRSRLRRACLSNADKLVARAARRSS